VKILNDISPLTIGTILILFISLGTATVFGSTFESEERIHISNLHSLTEDFYGFAEDIAIDGQIDGELTTFCNNMKINGEITGTVSSFSYVFFHNGNIHRSLRSFSYSAEVSGYVGGSLLLGANTIAIKESAVIENDARLYGAHIFMDGKINGSGSYFTGDTIKISGTIDGDIKIKGNKIYISPTAVINGNLEYDTKDPGDLDIADGAMIFGEAIWDHEDEPDTDSDEITAIVVPISKFLAAFLFGVIVISLFSRYAKESFTQLHQRFTISLATGFLSVFIFVFSILTFLFSLIFTLVGLIVISTDMAIVGAITLILSILLLPISSFLTVCGAIVFYAGKIVVGLLAGYFIFRLIKPIPAEPKKLHLFVGLLVLTLLSSIPYYVGALIYLFIAIVGGGAIVLSVRQCHKMTGQQLTPPEEQVE